MWHRPPDPHGAPRPGGGEDCDGPRGVKKKAVRAQTETGWWGDGGRLPEEREGTSLSSPRPCRESAEGWLSTMTREATTCFFFWIFLTLFTYFLILNAFLRQLKVNAFPPPPMRRALKSNIFSRAPCGRRTGCCGQPVPSGPARRSVHLLFYCYWCQVYFFKCFSALFRHS